MTLLSSILYFIGSFFFFVAGWGLVRMPDALSRLHAGTKSASLGTALIMIATALYFRQPWVILVCFLTILFVFLTAPLASHVIGKSLQKNKKN